MNYNVYTNKKIITKINQNNPSSIRSLRSIISNLYIFIKQIKQKSHCHITLTIIKLNFQFKKESQSASFVTNQKKNEFKCQKIFFQFEFLDLEYH